MMIFPGEYMTEDRITYPTFGIIEDYVKSEYDIKSPSLLEVNFLQNAQNRFQSLGLAKSVVTTSSSSFTFNADNQFVTTNSNEYLYIKPSNWSALVPAIQASLQLKMKLFIPS
jgi:hypothetical protein